MGITENFLNHRFDLNNVGLSNAVETSILPRHRWYYFKEGFSPNLVKTAVRTYNLTSKNLVLDPFNGSGTATLSAAENNIPSIGLEVNPFTAFVAKTKMLNSNPETLSKLFEETKTNVKKGHIIDGIEKYSTFTELSGKDKWLFNLDVLRAFYGGYNYLNTHSSNESKLLKLSLLTSIMENSNARKDGKCLKYRHNWKNLNYSDNTLFDSFERNYKKIFEDVNESIIKQKSNIILSDSRNLKEIIHDKFDLVVTSPPYLNTFDYTDIYRPELFLGQFIDNPQTLYRLRLKTIRSHIQAKWALPDINKIESIILKEYYNRINSKINLLMDFKIPLMILAYFEDMSKIFRQLNIMANKYAHIWMVVSTSAYANEELPVDLILSDIATKNGWNLKEIGVLREISKRKTKYSPDVEKLRESVIVLQKK